MSAAPARPVEVHPKRFMAALTAIGKFATRDDTLPTLNGVLVEHKKGRITVVGTDRFVLGAEHVRAANKDGAPFRILIPLSEFPLLKALLAARPAYRDANIELVPDSGHLNIAGTYIGVDPSSDKVAGDFPDWRPLLRKMALEPESADPVHLNLSKLQVFHAAYGGHDGLYVRLCGPTRPVLVTIADRFIGGVMPVRMQDHEAALTDLFEVFGMEPPPQEYTAESEMST